MKILAIVFVLGFVSADINKIAQINQLKSKAEQAFKNGDYDSAIAAYKTLTDSMGINEDRVLINLAHAYYHKKDTSNAANYYTQVLSSNHRNLRSVAYQQMGLIHKQANKLKDALADFKFALKSNPNNEEARYNYELLKKILKKQENQNQQNKNKDIKPSEYAKKIKAQADALSKKNMFEEALQIIQQGLKKDKTVAAYNDYISKLNDVVESRK